MQVKEGAARVALEYCALREREGSMDGKTMPQLTFIPVGITHTDKSHYQSRVSNSCLRVKLYSLHWTVH